MNKTNIQVEFRVIGDDFDPNEITSELNIVPTNVWKKGEKYFRGSKEHTKKYSYWGLSTGYEESLDVSTQLHKIINILIANKENLGHLKNQYGLDYRIDVVINVENSQSPALFIESEVIRLANDIGAEFDFDLYIMS